MTDPEDIQKRLERQELLRRIEELYRLTESLVKELDSPIWTRVDIVLWIADVLLFILGLLTAPVGGVVLVAISILIALGDAITKLRELAKSGEQQAKIDKLEALKDALLDDLRKDP